MGEIKQRLVSKNIQSRVTSGGTNKRKTLTVHQTGNTSKGANAEMHARLQENGNSRSASWHIQSDDKEIIQSFPFSAQTWHAGDGKGDGNRHSISWEICINSDGDYVKSLELATEGIAQVLKAEGLTVADLRQHNFWSGKNCPAQIRAGKDGVTWAKFKDMVQANMDGSQVAKPVSKPTFKPQTKPREVKSKKTLVTVDGYLGPETVNALQRYFGLIVDGEMWGQYKGNQATKAFNQRAVKYGKGGSPVVRALQKKIGVTADGIWGTATTRALQKYLGTPVDGEIWRPSTAIKELQKRLNNGTF